MKRVAVTPTLTLLVAGSGRLRRIQLAKMLSVVLAGENAGKEMTFVNNPIFEAEVESFDEALQKLRYHGAQVLLFFSDMAPPSIVIAERYNNGIITTRRAWVSVDKYLVKSLLVKEQKLLQELANDTADFKTWLEQSFPSGKVAERSFK